MKSDVIFGAALTLFFIVLIGNKLTASNVIPAPSEIISNVNKVIPFGTNFTSIEECKNYVLKNSGNGDKLKFGMYSCGIKFSNNKSQDGQKNSDTASCFLNNLSDIQDDSSGTKVVTKCAESTNNTNMGFVFSKLFSPSARVEEKMDDIAREQSYANRNSQLFPGIPMEPNGDGITIMNINGDMKTCIKMGVMLNCD